MKLKKGERVVFTKDIYTETSKQLVAKQGERGIISLIFSPPIKGIVAGVDCESAQYAVAVRKDEIEADHE